MKKNKIFFVSLVSAVCSIGIFSLLSTKTPLRTEAYDKTFKVYYAISDKDRNNYDVKVNIQNTDNAWIQYAMTKVDGRIFDGRAVYCADISTNDKIYNLQFQLYNGGEWKWQDHVISSETEISIFSGKLYAHNSSGWHCADYSTGRYIVGDFGACNWSIENAVYMNPSSQYEGNIDLEYGDEFKVAYWNGDSLESYFGYSSVTPNASAYYCFGKASKDDDANIKCYASGNYNFYFTDSNYDESYKISCATNGDLNSEHLAAKLMSYDVSNSAPNCKDSSKYSTCLTMFNSLSADEQDAFIAYKASETDQFKNAYNRMLAWSKANNLKDDAFRVKAISAGAIYGRAIGYNDSLVNISEESAPIIIIAVASTATLGLAGLYIAKRKKHE